MSDKRYAVPEGLLRTIIRSARYEDTGRQCLTPKQAFSIGEAVCCYLSENPIVPTTPQLREMLGSRWSDATCEGTMTDQTIAECLREWQRRMFLNILIAPETEVPEPGVPEEIKDLLDESDKSHFAVTAKLHREHVLEAYRRGQKEIKSGVSEGSDGPDAETLKKLEFVRAVLTAYCPHALRGYNDLACEIVDRIGGGVGV